MKLNRDAFHASLARGALKPCYWLTGDEPWQSQAARDALWQEAERQGYGERYRFDVNAQFDWGQWALTINSGSLFSQKRLVELRCASAKLSEASVKALLHYLQAPNPDVVVLIISPKLEQHAASQKVVAVVEAKGVVCQLWPLDRAQLPLWLKQRAQAEGLTLSSEALQCLVDYTEGNLLAAGQAIDLLALLYPGQHVERDHIEQSLAKQAKFDVFALAEAFLSFDRQRYHRMLGALKAEGVEPVLVLWVLVKELRLLLQLSERQLSASVWSSLGIWDKRRPLYQAALHSNRDWRQLLIEAAACDVIIKGYAEGNAWLCFDRLLF